MITRKTRAFRASRMASPRINPKTMPAVIAIMAIVARYRRNGPKSLVLVAFLSSTFGQLLSDFTQHVFQQKQCAESE